MFGFSPVLLSRTGFRTKFFHRVGLLLLFASTPSVTVWIMISLAILMMCKVIGTLRMLGENGWFEEYPVQEYLTLL